ncbi:unnamed protein product [Sphenostylis stenocarpa]|uniref:PHD finger protein ALFIN-LIKE n=1 Tax=Sphenostylis stenocarpa TaxID=92480 RepID=A0AA86VVA5_9FABA|nr:unnamed protein product [Sphenostylis stenocarpa]
MEAAGGALSDPHSVDKIFRDFKARRAAIVKALTTEYKEFHQKCDPANNDYLCLFGFPDEHWEVSPAKMLPPVLPKPVSGINYNRDLAPEKNWLSLVAIRSDTWLLSVAMYFGAKIGFDKADRRRLFNMINDLPTIFEVVEREAKKQRKERKSNSKGEGYERSQTESIQKQRNQRSRMVWKRTMKKSIERHFVGHVADADEFWICCEICESWFHGKCVNITPAKAEYIKHYRCPPCSNMKLSLQHMDAGEGASYNPRSVLEVFRDFKGRRAAILKALTTDVELFYQQCDPEKENLCLYGFPNENWEVNLPAEEVPPELPEPALGINFARDGMEEKDWLSLVAVHSDTWLMAVALFFGTRFGFDKTDRKNLFSMINDLPTIFEVVAGKPKKQGKEKSSVSNRYNNKSKSNSKKGSESQEKCLKAMESKEEDALLEDKEEEHGETLCGACGQNFAADAEEFWICCDMCETWFHGKCVKITPAKAESIKHYKCPSCSNKRARQL